MNRSRLLGALLACAGIGASETLHAQARGQPATREMRSNATQVEKPAPVLDEASRDRRIRELQAWLGRLVGKFEVDSKVVGSFGTRKNHSSATCSGFGDGPGVRCILGGTPLLYFGFNPNTLEIQVVAIEHEQPAAQSGMLVGDTVSFSTDNWKVCHKIWTTCTTIAEVTATPAGEIFMKIFTDLWGQGRRAPMWTKSGHTLDLELHLQRELPVDKKAPQKTP